MHYVIVQPTTYEQVLSSICFMPYWHYVALWEANRSAALCEDVTYRQAEIIIGGARANEEILIDMSSEPQIEIGKLIYRNFHQTARIKFIGYKPFIDRAGLPFFDPAEEGVDLLPGVFKQIYYYENIKTQIENDSHIVIEDQRKWVSCFLAVGCKRNCGYCYVSKTNYPYGRMGKGEWKKAIDYIAERRWNVHFLDENFYSNPDAVEILGYLAKKDIRHIVLADSIGLSGMIRKGYESLILDSGNILNEVGVEALGPVIDKVQNIEPLLSSRLNIFWLNITFFPNETIESLNAMGEFLWKYGKGWDELLPRLKTQSSKGGLGQFFQPYPGTDFWGAEGVTVSMPRTRLWPSFVGARMLDQRPLAVKGIEGNIEGIWYGLYTDSLQKVEKILGLCDGSRTVRQVTELEPEKLAIFAQLARFGKVVGQR